MYLPSASYRGGKGERKREALLFLVSDDKAGEERRK